MLWEAALKMATTPRNPQDSPGIVLGGERRKMQLDNTRDDESLNMFIGWLHRSSATLLSITSGLVTFATKVLAHLVFAFLREDGPVHVRE